MKCEFCDCVKNFLFTCPRCNKNYCSLNCYRNKIHLQCTESFDRENVETELKSRGEKFNEKKVQFKNPIIEKLKKFQAEDEKLENELNLDDFEEKAKNQFQPPEIDSNSLEFSIEDIEKMSEAELDAELAKLGIASDTESLLKSLNDDEREFLQELVDEHGIEVIPWWIEATSKVQDVDLKLPGSSVVKEFEKQPKISKTNKIPAEIVKYDILSVLTSYLVTIRQQKTVQFYSGLIDDFLQICPQLEAEADAEVCGQGSKNAGERLVEVFYLAKLDPDLRPKIVNDLAQILQTKNQQFLVHSMADLISAFQDRIEMKTDPKEKRQKFYKIHKKLLFYLNFLIQNGDAIRNLLPEICSQVLTEMLSEKLHSKTETDV